VLKAIANAHYNHLQAWRKNQLYLALVAGLAFGICNLPAPAASPDFAAGVASFKKHDFKGALQSFDNAIRKNPNDCNALYYKAVCLAQLGRTAEAKYIYAVLIKSYSSTDAGRNAESAMAYLDPSYLRQLKGQTSSSGGRSSSLGTADGAAVMQYLSGATASVGELVGSPTPCTVYFQNLGNNLYIDALIDNRRLNMIFDSGAHGCTIGLAQMKELGLKPPEGPPTGRAGGVGDGQTTGTWQMKVDLKVGTIEKRNFPIMVLENSNVPSLLGQTFFKEYTYSVDNGAHSIRFIPKQFSGSAGHESAGGIPFKREGNHIIVDVSFNGKTIPCFLDTGAAETLLTTAHCKEVGLTIPEDAETSLSQGVAGVSINKRFPVSRVACGSISKNDFVISVTSNPLPHPLLGQNFFGNLRYEVDDENHVIRMRY
jgi:predicted aspartyl protease